MFQLITHLIFFNSKMHICKIADMSHTTQCCLHDIVFPFPKFPVRRIHPDPLPSDSLCSFLVYYHSGCKQACQSHQQGHMHHHTDQRSRQPAVEKTININKTTELIFQTNQIEYSPYLMWSSQRNNTDRDKNHTNKNKYWNNLCNIRS